MNNLLPPSIQYNEYVISLLGTFNDPWMCANDICKILQYHPNSSSKAIIRHVDESDRKPGKEIISQYDIPNITSHHAKLYYINESGLMDLVCSCRIKASKDFKIYILSELKNMRSKFTSSEAVDNYKKTLPQLTEFTHEEMVIKLEEERQLRIAAEARAEEERLLKRSVSEN